MAMIKCPNCGKDISDRATVCPACGESIEVSSKDDNMIISQADSLGIDNKHDSNLIAQNNEVPPKKKTNRGLVIGIVAAIILIGGGIAGFVYYRHYINVIKPTRAYEEADELLKNGNYAEAQKRFAELGEFKDSKDMVIECDYASATDALDNGDYENAKKQFDKISDYKDSSELSKECDYQKALSLYNESLVESIKMFSELGDYKDSKQHIYDAMADLIGQDYLDACTEGVNNLNSITTTISKEILAVAFSGGGSWKLDTSSDEYKALDDSNKKLKEIRTNYTAVFTESLIQEINDDKVTAADAAYDDFHKKATEIINTSYLYTYANSIFGGGSLDSDLSDLATKEKTYNDAVNALKEDK